MIFLPNYTPHIENCTLKIYPVGGLQKVQPRDRNCTVASCWQFRNAEQLLLIQLHTATFTFVKGLLKVSQHFQHSDKVNLATVALGECKIFSTQLSITRVWIFKAFTALYKSVNSDQKVTTFRSPTIGCINYYPLEISAPSHHLSHELECKTRFC